MQITFETPEDPAEKRLSMDELRAALVGPKFKRRPDVKTIQRWMAQQPHPCPCKVMPGTGKGDTGRCVRRFLLTHVLAWLDDPAAYYGRRRRAS